MKKLRCYIYTRVSTEMQVDGYSLEAQKERLYREAEHRGMKVVGEYSDEGKSGKNIKGRPAFQKMLDDIKDGKDKVDYVLVFKLSRFGRNTADTLNSLQYMEDFGANLLCVEDGIDSAGASGKMMISVLAAVTEIERENIKEQTMAGRRQKAHDGKWNGGFAPYGYKLIHREGEKAKVLVIEEKEAELVRLIYDKFVNTNMGANAVAKWLNEHGYTKTVRQNGTMPTLSAHFVKLVLDNPVYMGKIAYGRRKTEKIDGTRNEFHIVKQDEDTYEFYEGIHEAIISEEMWHKAHEKRKITGVKYEKVYSMEHFHILSGLVRCPVCGAKMYGVVNRKKKKGSDEYYKDMWYYKCKNRIKVEGKPCSYKTNIRQDQLNSEVIAMIKWVLDDPDFKRKIAIRTGDSEAGSMDELLPEKERLQAEREKAENRKKKLLAKIGNMDVDDDLYDSLCNDFMGVVRGLTEQIAKIDTELVRNRLAIENAKKETFSVEQYYKLLEVIIDNLELASDKDLKHLINSSIESIEIFPDRQKYGRWIKSVKFKMNLRQNGEIIHELGYRDIVESMEKEDEDGEEGDSPIPYPIEQQSRRYVYCPNSMSSIILRWNSRWTSLI